MVKNNRTNRYQAYQKTNMDRIPDKTKYQQRRYNGTIIQTLEIRQMRKY